MEVEKNSMMQGSFLYLIILNYLSEQINDMMNSDMEEATDNDADKIIAEVEMKINGGGGNGGQVLFLL